MRIDFDKLNDGDRVILYPNDANPIHKKAVTATHQSGYFYCDGTDPAEGPDYYWRDIRQYVHGYDKVTGE